jgi:hypothetical protein
MLAAGGFGQRGWSSYGAGSCVSADGWWPHGVCMVQGRDDVLGMLMLPTV